MTLAIQRMDELYAEQSSREAAIETSPPGPLRDAAVEEALEVTRRLREVARKNFYAVDAAFVALNHLRGPAKS